MPLAPRAHQSPSPSTPESGARFSRCRRYRYLLWRRWSDGPVVNWILLNPSTADQTVDDPTIARCGQRTRLLGFGAMTVTNLFALRATRPAGLYRHDDPVGPGNRRALRAAAGDADRVVVGWGNHGLLADQGARVERLLQRAGIAMAALAVTARGQPAHPLYLPYRLRPDSLAQLRASSG